MYEKKNVFFQCARAFFFVFEDWLIVKHISQKEQKFKIEDFNKSKV